jgi:hypothetical protein
MSADTYPVARQAPSQIVDVLQHTLPPEVIPQEYIGDTAEADESLALEQANPSPAERFASHVDMIRDTHDALHVPRLRTKPVVVLYGAAASMGGLLWTTTAGTAVGVAEFGVVTTATAALLGRAILKSPKANVTLAIEKMDEPAQTSVDAYYELYKLNSKREDGTNRMALRWYGPRVNEKKKSGAELLHDIATLAKNEGIDEIAISPNLVDETAKTVIGQPGKMTSTAMWLAKECGMPMLGGRAHELLQVASPQEWIDYAIEGNPSEGALAMQGFLRKLEKINPEHPAVTTAAMYEDPVQRNEHLAKVLRVSMQRQVEEKLPPSMNVKRGDPRRGISQGRFVHLTGEKVDVFANGMPEAQTTLDRALQLYGPAELAALRQQLDNPDAGYTKTRILEYALYKTAVNGVSPFAPPQSQDETRQKSVLKPSDIAPLSVQRELAGGRMPIDKEQRIDTLSLRARRASAALLGIIMGFGLAIGTNLSDTRYDAVKTQAQTDIALEHGVQPGQADIDEKLVNKRLAEWSTLNTLWGDSQDVRNGVQTDLTDGAAAGSKKIWELMPWTPPRLPFHVNIATAGSGGSRSEIGNVPDGHENDPIWNISAHGDADASGLWIEGTSWVAHGTPAHLGMGMEAYWETDAFTRKDAMIDNHEYRVPQHIPFADIPYIEVTRKVSKNEFIAGPEGKRYLLLPVKQGMMPMSMTTDTQGGAHILETGDGTYAFVLNKDTSMPSEVTYRIRKYEGVSPVTGHHGLKMGGDMYPENTDQTSEVQSVLNQAVPGYKDAAPENRAYLLAKYLRDNFGYDTQPLSEKDLKHIKTWADYARTVLKSQKANCNVASTLVALSNRHTTVAVGFQNHQGDGENALQVSEAHMVDLGTNGVFDPTPSKQKITTDVSHADRHGAPNTPVLPWQAVVGLLVAAGAIAASRKSVRTQAMKLVHNAETNVTGLIADRAQKELDDMHISVLLATAAAAGQAHYGRDGIMDRQKIMRQAADNTASREHANEYLARPHIHTRETQKLFKANPNIVTPAMRRAARLAGRVARRKQ